MRPKEDVEEFCKPCKKYEDRWREAYGKKHTYSGMVSINKLLEEMFKESWKISQDVREHVVKSGMCKECPNTSIYDRDRIEELIYLGRMMRESLSDRSIPDIEAILKLYGEAMEEAKNDPYDALMILNKKTEKKKIDF